jgi:hypothetical protein
MVYMWLPYEVLLSRFYCFQLQQFIRNSWIVVNLCSIVSWTIEVKALLWCLYLLTGCLSCPSCTCWSLSKLGIHIYCLVFSQPVQLIPWNWLGVGRCSVEVRLAYSSMGTVFTTTMCDQAWLGWCRHPSSTATWAAFAMDFSCCWARLDTEPHSCLCATSTVPSSVSRL